jgi:putative Mn2+ efflux pump MntP
MFIPDFAFIVEENVDIENMLELFDMKLFITIILLGIISIGLSILGYLGFNLLYYFIKTIWVELWNKLTPGNEWLELTLIVTIVAVAMLLILGVKIIFKMMDKVLTKFSNEIKERDEKIQEIEKNLISLQLAYNNKN